MLTVTESFDEQYDAIMTQNCLLFKFSSKELLQDENILKVGVAPAGDANYLTKDYGACVAGTLDLQFLAQQAHGHGGGLARLAEDLIGVTLNKNWRIRCSDWEGPTLTNNQIKYAAMDAHIAIEIFKVLAEKLQKTDVWTNRKEHLARVIDEHCFDFMDRHYKNKNSMTQGIGKTSQGSM